MTTAALPTAAAATPSPGRRGRGSLNPSPPVTRRAQTRLGVLLVAPVMILTVVFFVFPLANALYYSVVDFDGIDPNPAFVGLANFQEMFLDPEVWHALGNNLIWIVIGTAAPLVIGLLVSVLLWTTRSGSAGYRVVFFLPYVLPGVAIGIVWGWIYDPVSGWLNQALTAVGLGALTRGWLGDPDLALFAVLATAIWAATGFVIVILLSALRNVDVELVDAAKIDGANPAQRLWYVILPQIMPVFLMVLTLTLVGGFSVFDIIFIMTGGGPANATDTIGTYAYSQAFEVSRIGYGTTLALLITVLSVPVAVFLNRLQRRLSIDGTGA
ncbi:multiple sugar transport system permease protein/raffinose/stachyose/melibiose transport system permease protein [Diaminobutyricimonas aerilata]|uniref:Multiple sugar transport system permease protein/raffinose/stachyose/melibiose transport system permease protein n=1 Tax=Diaminobutyricimonas aerilata TaxID=1162967 RepID=A0A2M9CFI6_9MICO|nr:sugar ABC transporter permease [Diaminobutyricimonas aerilata]PJJ70706.1 multiple sugar transport system permease protein/raffinose/stachyose/melibiose transport system permease protein [Diaminobutyricimonas aerilata]